MVVPREVLVNRKLLDSNFEGYKLDPVSLPLNTLDITSIDVVQPSDDQFSFLQQREFSLHNHLHYDPWNPDAIYIINSEKQILKIIADGEGKLIGPHIVWKIPFTFPSGTYVQSNATICFASDELAIVSDGVGKLYIISSGHRKHLEESWKELHSESTLQGIRLVDARSPASGQLHCLHIHVDSKLTYITHLHFTNDIQEGWKLHRSAVLFGKGSVDYVSLNYDCKTAFVIGQIDAKSQEYIDEESKKPSEETKEIHFDWQQNFDEIKVWIESSEENNPIVTVTTTNLLVKSSRGDTLLQGKFYRPVEDGLSVWQFIQRENKSFLEIIISKKDEGNMWPQLFDSSDFRGKEIPDPDLANEIHNNLAHLTSETEDVGGATVLNCGQLEECDISDGEGRLFVQYDLTSTLLSPISKTELGNGQWLMACPRTETCPPLFSLRFDVDGLVYDVSGGQPKHVASLCAFGFVQASKTSRLFSYLPSDLSYCGLVDADGRVFLYRGGVRPSAKVKWGSQHLIYLETKKIFGVHATRENLFVLSEKVLHLIKTSLPC